VGITKCGECGFSRLVWLITRWRDNGTATGISKTLELRSLIIEADFLDEFMASIEERLGVPIGHIVYEAQRNASVDVINGILGRFPAFITRIPGVKRVVVTVFCRMAVVFGMSYAKVVTYKSGVEGEALIRNPFNRELMAAIIVGAFEALEKKPYQHAWRAAKNGEIIHIEPEPSRPEIAQRLALDVAPIKKGHSDIPVCSLCGTPLAYRDLEWRKKEGIVMDTRRGVRMVFIDAYTPEIVVRELASELGDEVIDMVVDAHKAFCLHYLREEFLPCGSVAGAARDALYRDVLDNIIIRGHGNPVQHSFEGETFSVTVENPFSEHFLAAYFSALYELAEGREAQVTWEQLDPSTIRFAVTGA
jgi:hypothetical protein